MPELPEVEVTRRALDRCLVGRTVTAATLSEVWAAQLTRDGEPFAALAGLPAEVDGRGGLVGRTIDGTWRQGKWYHLRLAPQPAQAPDGWTSLEGHLRMSGGWWLVPPGGALPDHLPDKHCHCTLTFDDGSTAVYRDVRRFGTLRLRTAEDEAAFAAERGLDPFDPAWSHAAFRAAIGTSKVAAKARLLDQTRVAGLGNIYALEVLHRAGVDPRRPTNDVTEAAWQAMFDTILPLLSEAVDVGGTRLTALDDLQYVNEPSLYLDNFEVRLQVYGREAEPCLRAGCGGRIHRFAQHGRSSFACDVCQS